jgi:beta-glucanase (GH16 family)
MRPLIVVVFASGCVIHTTPGEEQQDGSQADQGAGGSTSQSPDGAGGSTATSSGGGSILCPYYDPECETGDPSGPIEEPSDEDFVLLWQDDFDTFDTGRWNRHDHTFAENAAYFSHDNVVVQDGRLILHLTEKANYDPGNEHDRPYLGAEVSTKELFKHVRVTARIKFAQGQGVVSSLFTYSDNAGVFWNEIDVEYLGFKVQEVQYNLITSACPTCGSDRSAVPYPDFLGIAPYADFHEYEVTWTPAGVSFKVDHLPRWSRSVPSLTADMRVRMNVWPTSGLDPFAGSLDPGAIPTSAEYDWIRIEQYVGP